MRTTNPRKEQWPMYIHSTEIQETRDVEQSSERHRSTVQYVWMASCSCYLNSSPFECFDIETTDAQHK
eukprot:4863069-Amphidinium_carterae.1